MSSMLSTCSSYLRSWHRGCTPILSGMTLCSAFMLKNSHSRCERGTRLGGRDRRGRADSNAEVELVGCRTRLDGELGY